MEDDFLLSSMFGEQLDMLPPPSLARVDAHAKVTGSARYCAEIPRPGLTHAYLVQSRIARGRITRLDTTAARQASGVVDIITADNCPSIGKLPDEYVETFPGERRPPLSDNEIHYVGQHIAVVIAETLEEARRAASLIEIEYESEPPVLRPQDALGNAYHPDHFGQVKQEKLQSRRGTPESVPAIVEVNATYETPIVHQNPMEMSSTTVWWESDEKMTIYDSTRWLLGSRRILAHVLGLKPENVHLLCPYIGGAFGSKNFIWNHVMLAAAAAKVVQRPVKLMLTRQQMFTSTGHRPSTTQQLNLRADGEGKLTAIRHRVLNDTSPVAHFVEPAGLMSRNLYHCENVEIEHQVAPVNLSTPCFMRGPGEAPGMFALESGIDELAHIAGLDPLEFRLLNYAETNLQEDKPYSSKQLRECYRLGAERFGWAERQIVPGRGYGMATAAYPGRRKPSCVHAAFTREGKAIFSTATHEQGDGTATVMVQIAAETMDIPADHVEFRLGDTSFPGSPVTGASQTTASVGPAVRKAALELREKLETMLGEDGIDTEDVSQFIAALARRKLMQVSVSIEEAGDVEDKPFTFESFGAHFCEVQVDEALGEVRVTRWVSVLDGGRILNANTARSQILGGIVFGLGMGLMEETVYDTQTARPMNPNLAEYLIPTAADVPLDIDVSFVEVPDFKFNELGVRGIGELGITGVPAAIANAVFDATGRRIRKLPIRVEDLL